MIPRNILLGGLAATASLAAQAQSSVTLYGLIDIAPAMVSRTNTADDRLFRLNSDTGSSSRFGVRGTEDLGGGLAAFFNLEAPLDAKNGSVPGGAASGACNAAAGCASATTPAFWRRNAYVGLRGGFGEVTFGRNYTAAIIKQAATLSATPSGINTGMATNLAAQGLSNDFWNSNQIRYDSPKFGPIDFSAHVALGEGVVQVRMDQPAAARQAVVDRQRDHVRQRPHEEFRQVGEEPARDLQRELNHGGARGGGGSESRLNLSGSK